MSNFKKIFPVAADLFSADRRTEAQTDVYDEACSLFTQFCECA